MEISENGFIAVVCYLSEPQKSLVETLRRGLPGNALAPLHITVLPPRPLKLPLEGAFRQIAGIASGFSAFDAELSEVRHFRESDFLYLDIGLGNAQLCSIHRRLNTGELEHPEPYEFRPHLTLGGPLANDEVQQTRERVAGEWKASPCPRSLKIDELVCLWQGAAAREDWERYRSIPLTDNEPLLSVSA